MQVVILGAGTVGSSIAELLCQHRHTVTMVDRDPEVIEEVDSQLDVGVVIGSASQSSVLFQAGVLSADLCLAVTGNDECNMVAASMAKAMGVKRVASRVYAPIFRDLSTFDYQDHFHIDRLLSIEHLSAMELATRIRETGAMMIENFARGELEIQSVLITRESSATGKPLSELKLPPEVRIGSINREGNITIAVADDRVIPGDRITLVGTRDDVEDVKKLFHTQSARKQSVVIAGGGETGYHLALVLENRSYKVTVMESERHRCDFLAAHLQRSTVVHADACRRLDLEEERIGEADVFIACTGDDENNIMACVEAQVLGTEKLMAIINRPDYANVVGKLGIDEAVSPREVVARQVLGLLNTGPIVFRNTHLLGGGIEVLELEVFEGSPITQAPLKDVELPDHCLIAAVIRDNYVQVPSANFQIRAYDTVISLVHGSAVAELIQAFDRAEDVVA
jgi:trk system potassium uptake protein TrkA